MDKITLSLINGRNIKTNYPNDSIPWAEVTEVEIMPEDIAPGTMVQLVREISDRITGKSRKAICNTITEYGA